MRETTGFESSAIAKGESLADVAEMFNHYGDIVVLRDSNEQLVREIASLKGEIEALRSDPDPAVKAIAARILDRTPTVR